MKEPLAIDISLPARSFEVKMSPPYEGTMTVVYPYKEAVSLKEAAQSGEIEGIGLIQAQRLRKVDRFAPYFGMSVVLDITTRRVKKITAQTLLGVVEPVMKMLGKMNKVTPQMLPPRLLLKTLESGVYSADEYPYLTVDAVEFLYAQDFGLFGIDTPSIDPPDGTDRIRYMMSQKEMVWLCNLDLSKCRSVAPYLLSAFPLFDVEYGPVPARAFVVPMMAS